MAAKETPAVPPKFIPDSMQYSLWKKEINMWSSVTNITKSKQGVMVALYSLPQGSKLKDNVMEQFGEGELKNERGLENLIKFLDKIYQKNDIFTARDKFNEFLNCELKDFASMDDYIIEHNRLYKRVEKFDICKLGSGARGFLLLERAKLTFKEEQLVLTGVKFEESDTIAEQIEASLLKFFSKQATSNIQKQMNSFTLKEEDTLYTAKYSQHGSSRGNFYRGNQSRGFNRGGWDQDSGNVQTRPSSPKLTGATGGTFKPNHKKVNLDQYGNIAPCYNCGSKFHFARECPDQQYSIHQVYRESHNSGDIKEKQENEYEQVEDAYAMNINFALKEGCFMTETVNCAILDSACTSTVCGQAWLTCYLDSLDCENREKVKEYESSTKFRFGNGNILNSLKRVHIPCTIANKTLYIKTDVVSSDIPLLLGKPTMKKMNVKLDMENDTVIVCGEPIKLDCTPSGHYFIPLARPNNAVNNVPKITCWYYMNRRCKFGHNCHHQHPVACKAVMEYGRCCDTVCKLLHPNVCRDFMRQGNCARYGCWFVHPSKMVRVKQKKYMSHRITRYANSIENTGLNKWNHHGPSCIGNNRIYLGNWPTPAEENLNLRQSLTMKSSNFCR